MAVILCTISTFWAGGSRRAAAEQAEVSICNEPAYYRPVYYGPGYYPIHTSQHGTVQ
jgi:hypothetical protein